MEWANVAVPTVQYTHGMLACSEFTGVLLSTLLDEVGYDRKNAKFVLAEGADGSASDAHDSAGIRAQRRHGRLRPERRDAAAGERLPAATSGAGRAGCVERQVAAPARGRRQAVEHARGSDPLHRPDARWHASPVLDRAGGEVRHHDAVQRPAAAGQGLLRGQRTGLERPRQDPSRRRLHRRRPQLGAGAAAGAGADEGADALPLRLELGRRTGPAAEPGRRRVGPHPAVAFRSCARCAARARSITTTRSRPGRSIRTGRCGMSRLPRPAGGDVLAVFVALGGRSRRRRRARRTALWLRTTRRRAQEIAGWDIDVRPDGHGVRKGKGTVAQGQDVYDAQCASCHGTFGESNRYMAIAGGVKTEDLQAGTRQRTDEARRNAHASAPSSTTRPRLWDYINRAMPWTNPQSLTVGPGLCGDGLRAAPERDRAGGLRTERRQSDARCRCLTATA